MFGQTDGASRSLDTRVLNSASSFELIWQPDWSAGIYALPPCFNGEMDAACQQSNKYRVNNPLYPDNARIESAWQVGQWGSQSALPVESSRNADGSYTTGNGDKAVTFFPDGRVQIAINALSELHGAYRDFPLLSSWPSFVVNQNFSAPGTLSHPSGTLATMQSAVFSMDIKLIYNNRNERAGYNPSKHSAIFPVYFGIQNLNPSSPDYGKYVFLGITPWADTADFPGRFVDHDVGTRMLIFSPGLRPFASESTHSGNWVHVEGDILPYAKEALNEAASRGYFSAGVNLNDFYIGGMNIGFEITGLNTTTIQFKNLSLKVVNPSVTPMSPPTPSAVSPQVPAPAATPVPAPVSTPVANGFLQGRVMLQVRKSGQCLDVRDGSRVQEGRIQQWGCNGGLMPQVFVMHPNNDGLTEIRAEHSNLCLDIQMASKELGAILWQYGCNGGQHPQQFKFVPSAVAGYYQIVNTNSGLCLDVTGGSLELGAQIIQYTCKGSDNQLFKVLNL